MLLNTKNNYCCSCQLLQKLRYKFVLTLDTGYDTICFLSNIDSIYYTKIVETDATLILLTPNT